jgi:endonuclease/exonuclease/phosphatase family metal-dependent hydrolase
MREKLLEIVFIALAVGFAVAGYGLHRTEPVGYLLTERNPDALRIVTWNVGGGSGKTGRPLQNEFVPHIAGVLAKLDADIVFLQEVANPYQLKGLSRILGNRWNEAVADRGHRQAAVLWQSGRLKIKSLGFNGRSALLARYHPSGRPPVLAINLHADPYSAVQRNALIGQATDLLMADRSGHVKILAGDLNLDIDLSKRRDLFSDDEHLDVETYNYIAQRLSDISLNTGSTAEPDRRLDYIFAESERVSVIRSGPWKGRRIVDMDHDPVVADLQFAEKR